MGMENRVDFYTPQWSHPDVILRLCGVEGPMRNEDSQEIVDFAERADVNAYVEEQWHPLMMQSDSVPTAVFEVPRKVVVPSGLRSYREDRELIGTSS